MINEALALLPSSSQSEIPAAMAIVFFIAPEISTPTISEFVYILMVSVLSMDCASCAMDVSSQAMTVDDGLPMIISSARFGPDIEHTDTFLLCPISSQSISDIRLPVACSNPFVALTMIDLIG